MWQCTYSEEGIEVYSNRILKGRYLFIQDPCCRKCACPNVTVDDCSWHWKSYGFERVYAMGAYYPSLGSPTAIGWTDFLSNHIRGLKLYPRYAIPLGLGLSLCIQNRFKELREMDVIVPVPKFQTELKKARNNPEIVYNQAVELSKIISKNTGIQYLEALRKTRAQDMKHLSWNEKWQVVKGLYEVADIKAVDCNRIMLVDDVYTSGATVSECSEILTQAGAKIVNVLVAGRDVGHGD